MIRPDIENYRSLQKICDWPRTWSRDRASGCPGQQPYKSPFLFCIPQFNIIILERTEPSINVVIESQSIPRLRPDWARCFEWTSRLSRQPALRRPCQYWYEMLLCINKYCSSYKYHIRLTTSLAHRLSSPCFDSLRLFLLSVCWRCGNPLTVGAESCRIFRRIHIGAGNNKLTFWDKRAYKMYACTSFVSNMTLIFSCG